MGVRTNFALFDVTFKVDVFLRVFLYHALFPFSVPIVVMREGSTFARNLSLYPVSPRGLLRGWVETMGFLINIWGMLELTVFRRDLHPVLLLILTYQACIGAMLQLARAAIVALKYSYFTRADLARLGVETDPKDMQDQLLVAWATPTLRSVHRNMFATALLHRIDTGPEFFSFFVAQPEGAPRERLDALHVALETGSDELDRQTTDLCRLHLGQGEWGPNGPHDESKRLSRVSAIWITARIILRGCHDALKPWPFRSPPMPTGLLFSLPFALYPPALALITASGGLAQDAGGGRDVPAAAVGLIAMQAFVIWLLLGVQYAFVVTGVIDYTRRALMLRQLDGLVSDCYHVLETERLPDETAAARRQRRRRRELGGGGGGDGEDGKDGGGGRTGIFTAPNTGSDRRIVDGGGRGRGAALPADGSLAARAVSKPTGNAACRACTMDAGGRSGDEASPSLGPSPRRESADSDWGSPSTPPLAADGARKSPGVPAAAAAAAGAAAATCGGVSAPHAAAGGDEDGGASEMVDDPLHGLLTGRLYEAASEDLAGGGADGGTAAAGSGAAWQRRLSHLRHAKLREDATLQEVLYTVGVRRPVRACRPAVLPLDSMQNVRTWLRCRFMLLHFGRQFLARIRVNSVILVALLVLLFLFTAALLILGYDVEFLMHLTAYLVVTFTGMLVVIIWRGAEANDSGEAALDVLLHREWQLALALQRLRHLADLAESRTRVLMSRIEDAPRATAARIAHVESLSRDAVARNPVLLLVRARHMLFGAERERASCPLEQAAAEAEAGAAASVPASARLLAQQFLLDETVHAVTAGRVPCHGMLEEHLDEVRQQLDAVRWAFSKMRTSSIVEPLRVFGIRASFGMISSIATIAGTLVLVAVRQTLLAGGVKV